MDLETSLELLDLTLPQVPPRSTLFHLKPIGVGTPYIESLSGYIARLALEHFITPHHLLTKLIVMMVDKSAIINSSAHNGRAINGVGNTSADLVTVFEKLTLRNDLRFTTLLPWAEVIPIRHLIRQHRAWCAACYDDWRGSGQVIYDPLIWAIAPVTACHKHLRYLESTCPQCDHQLHHLFNRTFPGYCSKCRYWLGDATSRSHLAISGDDLGWQTWVYENIGNLLAEAPRLISPPARTHTVKSISSLLNTLNLHQYRDLTMSLDVSRGTIEKWKAGKNLPHLSWLLQLSYQMKVRLVDILCREVINNEGAEPAIQLEAEIVKQIRYKSSKHDRTELQLSGALKEFPPRSLTQVALQIGCSTHWLKDWFPQLCQMIVTRYKQHIKKPFDLENAKKIIHDATREIPPPSLERVYRRLGGTGAPDPIRKHFPKKSRIILDRYKASKMKPFDLVGITIKLEAALNEWPPCSQKRFSERNNINPIVLYRKLPHLCKQLSENYRIYCKQIRAKEHEKVRKEARQVGLELHSKGHYPSLARIKAKLTIPSILWIIREVSKELLSELGYT